MQRRSSYLTPKCEARPAFGDDLGVFALEPIRKGELIAMWGGDVLHESELESVPEEIVKLGIQVEEELYLVSIDPGPADRVNHSCEPNAGINGHIMLVAMQDIQSGEQVCFDYAMSDGSPYDEFACQCGSELCRKQVTGNDWQLPELQVRYAGYFMPYLQRRIDALRAQEQSDAQRAVETSRRIIQLPRQKSWPRSARRKR